MTEGVIHKFRGFRLLGRSVTIVVTDVILYLGILGGYEVEGVLSWVLRWKLKIELDLH